jgi:hypothetical protein
MQPYPYTPALIAGIRRALSEPRFQTYLGLAGGDAELAMRQYVWNASVASGLQTPLHLLEVTVRNAVNDRLKQAHGANWLSSAGLLKSPETAMVAKAKDYLVSRGEAATLDKIVAELNFQFWVGIFSRKYDRVWLASLQSLFTPKIQRYELHEKLDRLRTLRNRIAHHETIQHRHLMADLNDIKLILGALSPTMLDWLNWHEQATTRFATPATEIDIF